MTTFQCFNFLISCFCAMSQMPNNKSGTLKIVVYGLHNNDGQIGISLFNQREGFPSDKKKVIRWEVATPANYRATIELPNTTFGEYAIAALHDVNKNKKMDTNFIGYPLEGFGASNNPKFRFGPPYYEDSKINFSQDGMTIYIEMKYF